MNLGLVDFSDDLLAGNFLLAKDDCKKAEEYMKASKLEFEKRSIDHGEVLVKSDITDKVTKRKIDTLHYEIIQEGRRALSPSADASSLFEEKGWVSDIDITYFIKVKQDVDVSSIPAKILESIQKYFEFHIQKSVSNDMILAKQVDGKLTKEEMVKCVDEKISFAYKVKKK